jgi:hypothetical protein
MKEEKEYKCNVDLKRLESEQKIMFVYSKLVQICVCGDVPRVKKLPTTNLVSLQYFSIAASVSGHTVCKHVSGCVIST